MEQFFIWLSNNPAAATALIAILGLLVVALVLIYIIAFFQGRSVSIWPPNIGSKPGNDSAAKSKGAKEVSTGKVYPIVSEIDARLQINVAEHLKTLHSLDLVGYNLVHLLHDLREPIADAVSRGATVRILVVDFTSLASQLMQKNSNRSQLIMADVVAGLRHIQDIKQHMRANPIIYGELKVRLTSWIPSCSMILINANEDGGIAKIGIHPPSFRKPMTGRLSLVLGRSNYSSEMDYFVGQFSALWEDSKKWDGTVPQLASLVNSER